MCKKKYYILRKGQTQVKIFNEFVWIDNSFVNLLRRRLLNLSKVLIIRLN